MMVHYGCMLCNLNQVYRIIDIADLDDEKAGHLVSQVMGFLAKEEYTKTNSEIMGETWELITREIGNENPYAIIKKQYNDLLLSVENDLQREIEKASVPFQTALRFAAVGNQIDFAGRRDVHFVLEDVFHCVNQKLAIDDSKGLISDLGKARILLYLGDNCGEIVLDKLFLQAIRKRYQHLSILYGVRGKPVINDVTMEDARMTGIEKVAQVIDNGSGALGTVLSQTSEEFRSAFEKADVVISKGQGNFESLSDCKTSLIYYLMMVKCERIARILGVQERTIVCMRNQYPEK